MTISKKAIKKEIVNTEKRTGYVAQRLLEPSTWAGILTIGAALATGGFAEWLNPTTLPMLTAGVGLILNKEG